MLSAALSHPRRVLMTLDAMGGVWPYALDLAAALAAWGGSVRLLGFGPPPRTAPRAIPGVRLVWAGETLDWMAKDEVALRGVGPAIAQHMHEWQPDVVHLAAPSQAAGLPGGPALVVQSHSCVPTWWAAVRGSDLPAEWRWQRQCNASGLRRADAVIVPSRSHGQALTRIYGELSHLHIVPNAAAPSTDAAAEKQPYVFAAGRWWDEGKNGRVLDQAAPHAPWPILLAGALEGPNGARLVLQHATSLGQLSAAEIRIHMGQAALFAAPSRYEPFGLAVLEAARGGAALVLADIATFRELWHGAAVFVDPADPSAWANMITVLAADPVRRLALAQAAQSRAASYSPANQLAALRIAYGAASRRQKAA